jgi:hypothetical protein
MDVVAVLNVPNDNATAAIDSCLNIVVKIVFETRRERI